MNFRHVRIKGRFLHDQEVFIVDRDKRLGIEEMEYKWYHGLESLLEQPGSDSILFRREHGCWVVTPFLLSDGKTKILVNRGWVPNERKQPSTRPAGQVEGEIELTGYVRTLNEKHSILRRLRNDWRSVASDYLYRDILNMAKDLKTSPIWLDLDRPSSLRCGEHAPLGGQTSLEYFNDTELRFLIYITLSMLTYGLWYAQFIGPIRHRAY